VVDAAYLAAVRAGLPLPPAERRQRLVEVLGVAPNVATVLTSHPKIVSFFDEASLLYADALKLGNFITSEVMRDVRLSGLDAAFPVTPTQLAELLKLVDDGVISGKQAKEVYGLLIGATRSPTEIVRERGMAVISDAGAIEAVVRTVLAKNAKQADAYRAGKTSLLGFFVGQVMKLTGGSAAPDVVNSVLKRLLDPAAAPLSSPTPAPLSSDPIPTLSPRWVMSQHVLSELAAPAKAAVAPRPSPGSTPPLPIEAIDDEVDTSPMAHSVAPVVRTLTSAAGQALPIITHQPDSKADSPSAVLSEIVSREAFGRIDLRVGVVISAARVPREETLLDLRVDTGDECGLRRIIAGLGLTFTPADLVGQRVIVAVNLEPRSFSKEIVSEGMILAAGPSDELALATVTRDVPVGTRVS
jgi:methionine--tRNA ligase beta chain